MPDSQEVLIGKLQEAVKNLGDRENEHHHTVMGELRDLKDNFAKRLDTVETTKISFTDFNQARSESLKMIGDHEARIRVIETWLWRGLGALGVLQIIVALAQAYFFKSP